MKKGALLLAFTAMASTGCGTYEGDIEVQRAEEMPCVNFGAEVAAGLDRTDSLTADIAFDSSMVPEHVEAFLDARDAWRMATSGRVNIEFHAESGITVDLAGKRPNIIVEMDVADLREEFNFKRAVGLTNYDNSFIVMGKNRSAAAYAHTALHELGHFIGLGHSTSDRDIMYRSAKSRTKKISCNDVRAFNQIYGGP